jgi:hypothetical protein
MIQLRFPFLQTLRATGAQTPLLPCLAVALLLTGFGLRQQPDPASAVQAPAAGRYLYVAVPGIRNYLGYGGHGLLVFDVDNGHAFVKRIRTGGLRPDGKPSNVKGVAVSVPLNSLFISTVESLQRIDLTTEKVLWEKPYEGGADRMAISPDGRRCTCLPSRKASGTWWIAGRATCSKRSKPAAGPTIRSTARRAGTCTWATWPRRCCTWPTPAPTR